jgi:hypothetical protein
MANTQQNNNQALEPGQAAAKAAILAECDRLAVAGVTFVGVHFDGCGDSGGDGRREALWQRTVCMGAISIPSNTRLRIYKTTSKRSFPSDTRTIAADLEMSFSTFTRES